MIRLIAILLTVSWSASAATYYAATNGTAGGAGTIGDPMILSNLCASASPLVAGDTVYVRGGVYPGGIIYYKGGTSNNPIVFKPYAAEQPIIESTVAAEECFRTHQTSSNTWFIGFEVRNSDTDRFTSRGTGFFVLGTGTKIINCVIHDVGVGIGLWGQASPGEISGCIIYNCGELAIGDENKIHGIYTHSLAPGHSIHDNIILNGSGAGVQAYCESGNDTPGLTGLNIYGNIATHAGILNTNASYQYQHNFTLGGFAVPVVNGQFHDNYAYHSGGFTENFEFGFLTYGNSDAVVWNNYCQGGAGCFVLNWTNFVFTNNTVDAMSTYFNYQPVDSIVPGTRVWDRNKYETALAASTMFRSNSLAMTAAQWQASFGFDSNSVFTTTLPLSPAVFIRTNAFDSKQVNVAVYNLGGSNTVPVNLTGIFATNAPVVAINVQDYFGARPYSNIWSGGAISLPMTNLNVSAPVGLATPAATGPDFSAFVLTGTPFTNAPPVTNTPTMTVNQLNVGQATFY